MHMAIATRTWTVEDVWQLPADCNRYEVIDGHLFVTPSPKREHQEAVGSLYALLRAYLLPLGFAHPYAAPADVRSGTHTMVQPDVYVSPLIGGKVPHDWNDLRRLLLAVEVLSASSARADRTTKRRLYLASGVAEYWIVDVDARLIERWRSGDDRPEIVTDRIDWQPDPSHAPLVFDLPAFFAAIPEDE